MAHSYPYEDDEDAKADELPSDEEGDPMTRKHIPAPSNKNKKPKKPPPVLGTQPIGYHQHSMQMRVHSHHIPSKTMPISLPEMWICSVCTFAENTLLSPVCGICGSLPPMDNKQKETLSNPHVRTVSEQISPKIVSNVPSTNIMLPHFLEEDDDKDIPTDVNEPSYMKQKSMTYLVTVLDEAPHNEKQIITEQIEAMGNKKELEIELYSIKITLERKIKLHSTRIIALNKQKSKVKSESELQSALWDKYYIILLQKLCAGYFNKLFSLIDIRIEVENMYLKCFELKLEKVGIAYDKLDETIDAFHIEDTKEYIKKTMFAISRIRISSEMVNKQQMIERLKQKISKMERKYEEKKELLNRSTVDHKKRAAFVTLYLKKVIDEFNAVHKNIKMTEKYFCRADLQENFNSFLLDERVYVGRFIANWCKHNSDIQDMSVFSLVDIWIFIERVGNTFCSIYNLQQNTGKYDYHEYCMRFSYVSVLNLERVDQILRKIVNSQQGRNQFKLLSLNAEYAIFVHFLKLKFVKLK